MVKDPAPTSHIIVMAVLPLMLNNLLTPTIIILVVSLTEFIKSPVYYVWMYGPMLWSFYHAFLFLLVYWLLRVEEASLREVIGPLMGKPLSSVAVIAGLLVLSVTMFQVAEPLAIDVIYGLGTWKQLLGEYRRIPLVLSLYGVIVTPLTAGVCEEVVWRGYLQTRLISRLGGKIWVSVALQAVLFGLWHSISIHAIFTAVFGFASGLVYVRTKRLAPIMISHWLGDVIGFSTMYFIAF